MGVAERDQLLERDKELTALVELLGVAREGNGRVVLVEGPAGIGKTRLLQAARESAKEAGMQMLAARGTELERDFPFALVRQLFEPTLRSLGVAEREDLLEGAARAAGPVVGIEPPAGGGEPDPADASFATLNALYWLTSNLAESAPTLLAVDDAHWSDQASLRFLRFLTPRLEELPVLLTLAARPSEPGADQELLDQIAADPLARVLRPRPLSPAAVEELVRTQVSSDAHEEFCAASHEATAGNPFMVRELLAELNAEGAAGSLDDARHVRELAPPTIARAFLSRLARLPGDAGRLARAVAVLGDDADLRQAAALAALNEHDAARAADALAGAGIVERRRPLRFAHPLVRNAVYADIPTGDKDTAHRAAARLLEEAGAAPERVAIHLLATGPAADAAVVQTLIAAADRALDRGAPEAAIAYARRALPEQPDAPRRRAVLWQLVKGSFRAGDPAALEHLEGDVLDELSADPERLMASVDELSYWLYGQDRVEDALALVERAKAAAVEAEDYDLVMRFEAWDPHLVAFDKEPPWQRHRDRIAPDTPAERACLALDGYRAFFAGEPAAKVADLVLRALGGGRIFDEHPLSTLHADVVGLLIATDELQAAEQALDKGAALARESGSIPWIAAVHAMRGELALARGEVAKAEPDLRAAVEGLRHGLSLTLAPDYLALLIEALVERGELEAAERELEAHAMTGAIPDHFVAGRLLHSRGHLRLAQGRTEEGLEDFAELGKRARRQGVKNTTALPTGAMAATAVAGLGKGTAARRAIERSWETARAWGAFLAVALTGLGHGNPARALADLYLRGARHWGAPRVVGIGLHAMGVVRGGEKGIALLREAVATLEDSPARLEHAKALTDLGAALRRANRRAEAREPLRAALEMARRGGALAVARRAHEELEATGETLGRFAPVGVESLTPSERRIAGLAAEGMTNRQIAQNLFLSIKTVESHLRGAYRKLDIERRSELPDALEAGR